MQDLSEQLKEVKINANSGKVIGYTDVDVDDEDDDDEDDDDEDDDDEDDDDEDDG